MKKGQTSVNRSATRAGARPPKMALARILRSGFRRVIRKPSTSRTLRPVVPPEDARDALQATPTRRGPVPECQHNPRSPSSVAGPAPLTPEYPRPGPSCQHRLPIRDRKARTSATGRLISKQVLLSGAVALGSTYE